MHQIIHINFLVIAIFASANASARIYEDCPFVPKGKIYVCGSDGKTYTNIHHLWCAQKSEYGRKINLQLIRRWHCFIWEKYGIETTTFLYVSKFRFDY